MVGLNTRIVNLFSFASRVLLSLEQRAPVMHRSDTVNMVPAVLTKWNLSRMREPNRFGSSDILRISVTQTVPSSLMKRIVCYYK
jgi:hypothetical protein